MVSFENVAPLFCFLGILIVVLSIAVPLLVKTIKYGGFKAALFDAYIQDTIGEVLVRSAKMHTTSIRISKLDGNTPDKAVGIEIFTTGLSTRTLLFALSAEKASRLAALLEAAAAKSDNKV
ncbi:MAG: hypothetical protein R2911_32970 [Caldilineaceae bacterium]